MVRVPFSASHAALATLSVLAVLVATGCDAGNPEIAPVALRFDGAVHRAETGAVDVHVTGGRLVATARSRGALAVELPRAGAAAFIYRAQIAPGGTFLTETAGEDGRSLAWTSHVRTDEGFALTAGAPGLHAHAARLEAYDGDMLVYSMELDANTVFDGVELGLADGEPTSWHVERLRFPNGTIVTIITTDYRRQSVVDGKGDGRVLFTPPGSAEAIWCTDVRIVFASDEAPAPTTVRFTQTAGGSLELRDERFGLR